MYNQLAGLIQPVVTGTAASGAVSMNGIHIRVTSESLTTAAGAEYTLTITNPQIKSTDMLLVNTYLGSSTAGTPGVGGAKPANGSAVVNVTNLHATDAFNGTIVVDVLVVKSA